MLIGFMGGLNHPDLANRAGEEVLPQSDTEESDGEVMGPNCSDNVADISVGQNDSSIKLITTSEDKSVERAGEAIPETSAHPRPELSRPLTDDDISANNKHRRQYSDAASQTLCGDELEKDASSHRPYQAATESLPGLGIEGITTGSSPLLDNSPGVYASSNSPVVRRFTVSTTIPVPGEILPAMQKAVPSNSSRSPIQQGGLPSLHDSGLKPLLDGRPPKNGLRTKLTSTNANVVLSPPMSAKISRFPSPSSHSSSTFSPKFSHGHPSPAYSHPSPRDSTHMSPPSRPNVQLPPFVARPSSDALTPQSADSYTSSCNGGHSPKSATESIEIDRVGRVLPPLIPHPGPPVLNGCFQCKFEGCTAPPFQTQYLLK